MASISGHNLCSFSDFYGPLTKRENLAMPFCVVHISTLRAKIQSTTAHSPQRRLGPRRLLLDQHRFEPHRLNSEASHVVGRRPWERGIAKEAPLPIWCSVRLPLNPLDFNED